MMGVKLQWNECKAAVEPQIVLNNAGTQLPICKYNRKTLGGAHNLGGQIKGVFESVSVAKRKFFLCLLMLIRHFQPIKKHVNSKQKLVKSR